MDKTVKKNVSGRVLLIPFGIVLLFTSAVNLIVGVRMADSYSRLEDTTEACLEVSKASEQFKNGSDILTSNVRLYVATGEIKYMDGYFTEANETKNRDKAMASVENYGYKELTMPLFQEAMIYSTNLMQDEYHAMKLVATSYSQNLDNYPEIKNYNLTDVEKAFTTEQMLETANSLVNGDYYNEVKKIIYQKAESAFEIISEKNDAVHTSLQAKMKTYVTVEVISTSVFTFLLLLAIFMTGHSMLFPLSKAGKAIDKDEPMDETYGLEEYTTVAVAYNRLLARRDSLETELRNIANTDPLTGLPNRNAITGIVQAYGNKVFNNIAVLSLDVNQLKETNDTKGHKAGDELLCNSADCILDFFGNESRNNCCRIGGDEFTAFLMGLTEEDVIAKIETFNRAQHRYGVSIAVGYSYRTSGTVFDMRQMYEEADEKMYKAKKEYYKSHGLVHPTDTDSTNYN